MKMKNYMKFSVFVFSFVLFFSVIWFYSSEATIIYNTFFHFIIIIISYSYTYKRNKNENEKGKYNKNLLHPENVER